MIEENERLGSLLKYELDRNYSRAAATIAKGQNLKMGAVVSKNAADGTYQMLSLSKDDTGETDKAAGVLLEDVDATDAAKKALVLARIGIIDGTKIVYPDAVTEDQKKSIRNELENIGIITTTGA